MTQWEYKTVGTNLYYDMVAAMNVLGKEGWELVTVVPVKDRTEFLFKRALLIPPASNTVLLTEKVANNVTPFVPKPII